MIPDLWQDLRFSMRMLITKPGFTLAAVLALALGVGANTAIFSVMMAVLVRPLPFGGPETLVYLWNTNPALGARQDYFRDDDQTLGAQPLLGRAFTEDDEDVVIIGYDLWQRQFGGDPNLIGQKVNVENFGERQQILIGVMPPEFDFPPPHTEVWFPYELTPTRTGNHYLRAAARLKRGVTAPQAQSELNTVARTVAEQTSHTTAGWEVSVVPIREFLSGSAHIALPLLLGAVSCVLLIACVNVANLQLARAAGRQKEIAVKLVLGAGRRRIIRQLLTESLLLALAGGALGLLLALWVIYVLRVMAPGSIPRLQEVTINAQALWFTLALSILTGVLFGLAPAWQSSNPDLHIALKDSGLLATTSARGRRFRQALIVSQVAIALTLLVGAGLLIKSFWHARQINLGFATEHVLTATVSPSWNDYPHGDWRRTAFYQQALARIGSLPGVVSTGAISQLPLGGREIDMTFEIKGRPNRNAEKEQHTELRIITPSYFGAFDIPLRSGRLMTDHDTKATPLAVIVNETFARRYFPGRSPLGERLKFLDDFNGEIVGVVGDVRQRGPEAEALPEMYISYLQKPMLWPRMDFVIRATSDPASLAARVRRELQAVDPNQPVYNVQPMERVVSASTAERRFNTLLLAAFAMLAMLLAAAGIYGVISYSIAERTREIGIRMALGAQSSDVMRLVTVQGMKLALIGVAIGLLVSMALTRLLISLLFGVSATDPLTFAAVPALLAFVALLACLIPARRATKVDPMVALRRE